MLQIVNVLKRKYRLDGLPYWSTPFYKLHLVDYAQCPARIRLPGGTYWGCKGLCCPTSLSRSTWRASWWARSSTRATCTGKPLEFHNTAFGHSESQLTHILRAVCGRIENTVQGLPPPYRLNKPHMNLISSPEVRLPGKAPSHSVNWTIGTPQIRFHIEMMCPARVVQQTKTNQPFPFPMRLWNWQVKMVLRWLAQWRAKMKRAAPPDSANEDSSSVSWGWWTKCQLWQASAAQQILALLLIVMWRPLCMIIK